MEQIFSGNNFISSSFVNIKLCQKRKQFFVTHFGWTDTLFYPRLSLMLWYKINLNEKLKRVLAPPMRLLQRFRFLEERKRGKTNRFTRHFFLFSSKACAAVTSTAAAEGEKSLYTTPSDWKWSVCCETRVRLNEANNKNEPWWHTSCWKLSTASVSLTDQFSIQSNH